MNAVYNWSPAYCNGSSLLVVDDAIARATVVGRPVPGNPRIPSGQAAAHAPKRAALYMLGAAQVLFQVLRRKQGAIWRDMPPSFPGVVDCSASAAAVKSFGRLVSAQLVKSTSLGFQVVGCLLLKRQHTCERMALQIILRQMEV